MRVILFATCLVDRFHAGAGIAAAKLLDRLGVDVHVPSGQTCCGQPAFNAGYRADARRVAEYNAELLSGDDRIVVPSGSCAAMLRHHYLELDEPGADDGSVAAAAGQRFRASAAGLARRTFELTEFIVRVLGVTELGSGLQGRRIAWHHGCHGLRELRIRDEPLLLLRNAGAEIVPWEAAEECCGFGGLFSVKLPAVSAAMADRKLDTLPVARAAVPHQPSRAGSAAPAAVQDATLELSSADAGCLLQLAGRLKRRGSDVRVRHVAELLLEATHGST